MFSISNISRNGFEIIRLTDESNGTHAEVIPACGGILHAFVINNREEMMNVVDSYSSKEDFEKHVTSKGFLGCKLSPFVCRINKGKYEFDDKQYAVSKFFDVNNNALHGMLYDSTFNVVQSEADAQKAIVKMSYAYSREDAGYPFNYECVVKYELHSGNMLHVITEVTNTDAEHIPIQDGWHPYFNLGDKINDLKMQFKSKEMVEFDKELIPTGQLSEYRKFNELKTFGDTMYDNCFVLDFLQEEPMCVLRNDRKKIQVEIMPDKSYPYLQFYTPDHRKSIAIENISGAPDAFNNGMGYHVLSPGESKKFKTGFKITLL